MSIDRNRQKQDAMLRTLVGMKRQRAEQYVRDVQEQLRVIEAELGNLSGRLTRMNQVENGYEELTMSRSHGHVEHLLASMKTLRAALSLREAELERAKEGLRRIMHSEEQLGSGHEPP